MADVRRLNSMIAVEGLLERKDDDHAIDVLRNLLHASAPPGPELRRNVVDDAQSQLSARAGHAQIETGVIDEQHDIRFLARDLGNRLLVDPPEHAQMAEDVEEADDAHLAGVMHQTHPFAREQIAADAEGLDRWIETLDLAQHFGGVQIAGGLTGDDGQFHRSGNGNISHASAMPPKKSEQKMTRNVRIRSARVPFQSSAKKMPGAIA